MRQVNTQLYCIAWPTHLRLHCIYIVRLETLQCIYVLSNINVETMQHLYHHTPSLPSCSAVSAWPPPATVRARHHNGSAVKLVSPDIIEKDSRNGGIHYPPSMYDAPRPVFLSRGPIMDNEKDMTRTPTTPRSPPAPAVPPPASIHDATLVKGGDGTVGVLSRGAHLPPYHSTSSTTMSSSSSSSVSSESGGSSARTQPGLGPGTSYASGTSRMGRVRSHPESYHQYRQHLGQHGSVVGAPYHRTAGHSDPHYRTSLQDPRYRPPPQPPPPSATALYNQPAHAYSTYPSESYGAYRSNYSRPLSTGSLSSITTASSRPGFSSLDEFPNLHDHRSTFVHSGAFEVTQHHRYTGGGGVATYGMGNPRYPSTNSYHHQFHDHPNSSAFIESPLSPQPCDEHQPLLSLPPQGSLLAASSSDELGGQLAVKMSRTLDIQDQRTVQQEARGQPMAGSSHDNSINILEHPRDVEVLPKDKVILRCVARINRCGQLEGREEENEPNLLWYKDAEPLIGEIDSNYVVEEATEKDVGAYYCLVTHPDNEQIQRQSNTARLTIKKEGILFNV